VSPGMIATGIHAAAGTPDRLKGLGPILPMGRAGRPREGAQAILFLLSAGASDFDGGGLRGAGGGELVCGGPGRLSSRGGWGAMPRDSAARRRLRGVCKVQVKGSEPWSQRCESTRPAVRRF